MYSMKRNKRWICMGVLMCLCVAALPAESTARASAAAVNTVGSTPTVLRHGTTGNARVYSRTQVLFLGTSAYGSFVAAVLLSKFVPTWIGTVAGFGVGALGLIPLWFVDLPQGALLTGATGLSIVGGILISGAPDVYGDNNGTLAGDAITIGSHLGMWSSYEAYALARVHTAEAGYSDRYRNYSFGELFAAPYQAQSTSRLSFWVPLIGSALADIGLNLAADGGSHSVFTTGKSFIGTTEVPILVGLLSTAVLSSITYDFVGIGEEALFRDLEYKELRMSLGLFPAKLIDGAAFPALHIPQEVQAGYSVGRILVDFAYRSAATIGLQWAYDEGGLPSAVALHMWIDTTASIIGYLVEAGTPAVATVSFDVRL